MKRPIVIVLLTIALVFVLAGIGAVLFFAFRGGGLPTDILPNSTSFSATAEESKTLEVDGPVSLTVMDDAGDVTVTGADVEEVTVNVTMTGYGRNQAQADEVLKDIQYKIEQKGNSITLTFDYPKINTNINQQVDFTVTVPTEATVKIDSNFGKVDVADTQGDVDITNDFGDVDVQNIEGALIVQTNSGTVETVSIQAGSNDIELNSDFGNIILEQARAANITFNSNSGKVTLKDVNATGDLNGKCDFGDTKYENGSAASITIESNSGKVELTKVRVTKLVKVDDEFGDITLTQVTAASYDLYANSGTIIVDGAKGGLKAHSDFGSIEITNATSVTLDLNANSGSIEFDGSLGEGPHLVNSDFGNITLVIPADSELNVDLRTDFGKIKSDIPISVTLTESSSGDTDEISGTINGGGGQLTVTANSGNITINAVK